MRPRELVVSRRTDQGRLAGAVAAQVRSIGTASVVAMGPEAVFVALRAIITAGEFLRRERPGKELAVALEQRSVERRGSAEEEQEELDATGPLVEMRLGARLLPRSRVAADGEEVAVRVAQGTNLYKAASFVARAVEEGRLVQVRALR